MFGTLRNGILIAGISLALLGASGTAWADLPSADASAQTTQATTDTGAPESSAPLPRLFTLSELSIFFERLLTSEEGLSRVNDLGAPKGGATGGVLR